MIPDCYLAVARECNSATSSLYYMMGIWGTDDREVASGGLILWCVASGLGGHVV